MLASLIGYPLLILTAWAVARRHRLPPLRARRRSDGFPDGRGRSLRS